MTRTILIAMAMATLAVPAQAALSPTEKQEARKTYERAVTHYNLAEFNEAAEDFKTAYKIVGEPSILYNIAQSYRFASNSERAIFFYQSFLHAMPAAPNRALIERRIKELGQPQPAVSAARAPDLGAPPAATGTPAPTTTAAAAAAASGSERLKPVVELIKANRQGFRDCFDKWSKANPGKGGKVNLVFFLDPDGAIGQADADTVGFEAPEVSACVVAHARTLAYPVSANGKFTRISYPFDFKPR